MLSLVIPPVFACLVVALQKSAGVDSASAKLVMQKKTRATPFGRMLRTEHPEFDVPKTLSNAVRKCTWCVPVVCAHGSL